MYYSSSAVSGCYKSLAQQNTECIHSRNDGIPTTSKMFPVHQVERRHWILLHRLRTTSQAAQASLQTKPLNRSDSYCEARSEGGGRTGEKKSDTTLKKCISAYREWTHVCVSLRVKSGHAEVSQISLQSLQPAFSRGWLQAAPHLKPVKHSSRAVAFLLSFANTQYPQKHPFLPTHVKRATTSSSLQSQLYQDCGLYLKLTSETSQREHNLTVVSQG